MTRQIGGGDGAFEDTDEDGTAELQDDHTDHQGGDARNIGAMDAATAEIADTNLTPRSRETHPGAESAAVGMMFPDQFDYRLPPVGTRETAVPYQVLRSTVTVASTSDTLIMDKPLMWGMVETPPHKTAVLRAIVQMRNFDAGESTSLEIYTGGAYNNGEPALISFTAPNSEGLCRMYGEAYLSEAYEGTAARRSETLRESNYEIYASSTNPTDGGDIFNISLFLDYEVV